MNSTSQVHTFHVRTDVDWFVINNLTPGWWYNISTSNLVGGADTVMILYDQSNNIVKTSDDIDPVKCLTQPQYCASSISWKPTYSGPYYLSVRTLTYPPREYPSCPCPGYNIAGRILRAYLPIIVGPSPTTPTPTPTGTAPPTLTPTPTATPRVVVLPAVIPGPRHPKDIVVNPRNQMVYVTARDEDRLYMIDGLSLAIVNSVKVGREPWGVSINPNTNKVYVANHASGEVWVLDGATLAVLATIPVGPNPTFVKVNEITNVAYAITYGNNGIAVINGDTNSLIGIRSAGGAGAWGLAINPNRNLVYTSARDTGEVSALDAKANLKVVDTISPCGGTGSSPYGLEFNPANDRLYIACAERGIVDTAAIYRSTASGLFKVARTSIGNGGRDGGGGVAVNTANGHAFFTNSVADTVSVLSGSTNSVIATVPVGDNPFGIAVDPTTGRVYVADRDSNDVYVFADPVEP